MTATHGVSRLRTRTAAAAGIVTAGAAALSLVHVPAASADAHTPATAPTTVTASAPAFSAPAETGTPESTPDTGTATADTPATPPQEQPAAPADDKPQEQPADTDEGRGAEYNADGTLVVIDKKDQPKPEPASAEQIDQWINEALDVLRENDIPASYEGIHSNLMRESSGDPQTINMWDSNAHKNIPSKGLLQVIDPTFEQYHVDGTSTDIYDPVANIAAACNYAADRYGSMDNVNSAY
ncbi:transglycosylase SLT domain-containing protein [Streptomyces carpaticus]|uniref:Transglycosylase SLT domain-containing protein n=1 Tax=Streptomyces carpaticus TaxID=285558 RepID=A0ABV4ZUP3_9ACTN